VEGLEKELETLRMKDRSGGSSVQNDKKSSQKSNNSSLLFSENHFSPLSAETKSSSVDNIVDRVENETAAEGLLDLRHISLSGDYSPRLSRSKSTNGIVSMNSSVSGVETMPGKSQRPSVVTKLSPRIGRKKNRNQPTDVHNALLPQSNLPRTGEGQSLPEGCYRFLDMHNKFRRDIEKLTKKIESTV